MKHPENLESAKIYFDKAKGDFSNVNPPRRGSPSDADNRHVYGAACSWNGPIAKIGSNGGLPACPHCKGMLFEMDAGKWHAGIADYCLKRDDRDYPAFMAWLSNRGTCSPFRNQQDLDVLRSEFNALTP